MSAALSASEGSSVRSTPRWARGRTGGRVAAVAAGAWVLLGLESVLRPGEHDERDTVWFVPWLLTMAAFTALHRRQRRPDRRLERWSFAVVIGTMAAVALGQVGVILDLSVLKALGFPLGALLWMAALVPLGVATARAGVVRRHVGVALALLEPGSILTGLLLAPIAGLAERGGYSGAIEKGLVVALLARALIRAG